MEEMGIAALSSQRAGTRGREPVAWRDLRDWLKTVEAAGELQRVQVEVDPKEELSAITLLSSRRQPAPALLFEKLKGDRIGARVLSNMLGSSVERFALTLGLDPSLHPLALVTKVRELMRSRLAPVTVPHQEAAVTELTLRGEDIDLTAFPVPQFWPGDGGRYIGTGDVTLTQDPASGRINVGTYRQMLHGKNRVGMYCSPGKHGRLDREAWWRLGKPCPVVAAYGIDPGLFMVGALTFGANESELDVAGGLLGRPVALTPGIVGPLPMPAHAEIVIEGELHADETEMEGPLGEFTGYYGNERAPQPVIRVKALHMRRNPIHTAALMANPPACEIGAYAAIMRSARIWEDLDKLGVPGIAGVWTPMEAVAGWGMTVVSLEQKYAGHVAQALSLAAQCPAGAYFTKWIIAVDEDVDPTSINEVIWAMNTRCDPGTDLDFLHETWSTGLDPSRFPPEMRPYGSKVLIDACRPHRHLKQFPERTLIRRDTYERVSGRWKDYGFADVAPFLGTFHPEKTK
jgi:4-hydroxy-3-polyprenylbenzoate decarboxylase